MTTNLEDAPVSRLHPLPGSESCNSTAHHMSYSESKPGPCSSSPAGMWSLVGYNPSVEASFDSRLAAADFALAAMELELAARISRLLSVVVAGYSALLLERQAQRQAVVLVAPHPSPPPTRAGMCLLVLDVGEGYSLRLGQWAGPQRSLVLGQCRELVVLVGMSVMS